MPCLFADARRGTAYAYGVRHQTSACVKESARKFQRSPRLEVDSGRRLSQLPAMGKQAPSALPLSTAGRSCAAAAAAVAAAAAAAAAAVERMEEVLADVSANAERELDKGLDKLQRWVLCEVLVEWQGCNALQVWPPAI